MEVAILITVHIDEKKWLSSTGDKCIGSHVHDCIVESVRQDIEEFDHVGIVTDSTFLVVYPWKEVRISLAEAKKELGLEETEDV